MNIKGLLRKIELSNEISDVYLYNEENKIFDLYFRDVSGLWVFRNTKQFRHS